MTQQEKTALKDHENKCEVIATLSEFNLEYKTRTDDKGVQVKTIQGTIVGKISDTNSITLRCYSSELTNSGDKNKVYEHLAELMGTWKDRTIASAGEENALRFNTKAEFQPTHYIGNDKQLHEGVNQYRASFFRTEDPTKEKRPNKAEIMCDLYVASVHPESNSEGETGRWIIDGYVVTYSGIEKTKFVMNPDMANGIESYIYPGDTAMIYANVVNSAITTKVIKKMAFGPDREEEKTEYKNELIVTGLTKLNGDADPTLAAKAIDVDAMRNAINNYNQTIESLKNGGGKEQSVKKAEPAGQKPLW